MPWVTLRLVVGALTVILPASGEEVSSRIINGWATNFGHMHSELCGSNTSRDAIRNNYQNEARIVTVDGLHLAIEMAQDMMRMMGAKKEAVMRIVETAENAVMSHDDVPDLIIDYFNAKRLNEYETHGSNITLKPGFREFKLGNSSKHFSGIPVNMTHSTVHVPTNVYDKSTEVMNAVKWSQKLDSTFVSNQKTDPAMSWQYFGSSTGIMRMFPGVKWLVDENDPDLYDARMREWYIRAASSPKDVVILMDLSGSMTGLRMEIAKHVVMNILDTLNTNDYVNIYNFSTEATPLFPCFNDTLVQASTENIRIFREALDTIETRELANFPNALTKAFETLIQEREAGMGAMCNQAIMLITDGAPERYESVFKLHNGREKRVRVFTYLIGRDVTDREATEWMACENKGYFTHVTTLAEVREQVQKYVPVLARPWVLYKTQHPVIWTGVYADIADPKLTDWLWEIRERARQYKRSRNYQKLLRASAPPKEQYKEPCFDEMENFLTYGVRHLNHSERVRLDAERYMETRLDLRETSDNDKWTLYIGRTASEATRRGYRLMTSVSVPVFDKKKFRKRVARLLGVAGTDVPLSDIQELAPPFRLGVNGYSFLIDNNGYVLYHPDLRPVHREATKQFQEILKPNYNTVDLSEVEIVNYDRPRVNDSQLYTLRKNMIDREKAEYHLTVRQHLDEMKRVVLRKQKYHIHPVNSTPFSLAIVLPEGYGDDRVKGAIELTQAWKRGDKVLEYFEGPNWSVHPEWVYCQYDNHEVTDAHSLDTPQKQYLHFLKRMEANKSRFEWRSARFYPSQEVKNNAGGQFRSNQRRPNTYFCDKELFQSAVFDAKVTMPFTSNQSFSAGLFNMFGAAHSFVATRSGFTRWRTHWPKEMEEIDHDLHFTAVRATDEIWYRRAVDYHRHESDAFVYSVPFDAGLRNESLVTAAQAIFLRDHGKSTPAAVVGMQFLLSRFKERFFATTVCPSLLSGANCNLTCASDDRECYLLDDSGYVVVSKHHEQTGRFFGDVDGTVLRAMLQHKVYKKITMFDYQAVCLDVISTGSAAWTVMTPVRYARWLVGWLGSQLLWLLAKSQLLHLVDLSLAWTVERAVYDEDMATEEDMEEAPQEECVKVQDLFKMAHINKTRPRPCDKKMNLYTLNHPATSLTADLNYCYGIDGKTCSRRFVLRKVPRTNLVLLVVNTLCPCERETLSVEPEEWLYPSGNDTECARLRTEPYRRRPNGCQMYHAEEDSIKMCGRSGATGLSAGPVDRWQHLCVILAAVLWLQT